MKHISKYISRSIDDSVLDLPYARKQLAMNYLDFLNQYNALSDALKLTKQSVNEDIENINSMELGYVIVPQVIGRMIERRLVENINKTNTDFEFEQGNENTRTNRTTGTLKDKDLMCVHKPTGLSLEALCYGIEDVYEDIVYIAKSDKTANYIYGIELKTTSTNKDTFLGNKAATNGDNTDNVKNSFYILIKYKKNDKTNLIENLTAYFTFITHGGFVGSSGETVALSSFKVDDACIEICKC
jgi:hypothetical protein